MTHCGVGLTAKGGALKWLTIHMVERVITFERFVLNISADARAKKSIRIEGLTFSEKIRFEMSFGMDPDTPPHLEKTIAPGSDGRFSVDCDFDLGDGNYNFIFSTYRNGNYQRSNFFSLHVK